MKKDIKVLNASIGIGFYSLFSLLLFLIINIFVWPIPVSYKHITMQTILRV
ncbi:MAG: hypothetical protein K2I49_00690 [Ureaplasma sp.]|nr:hypothetical protein [Ureaplasma sp.]